MNRPYSYYRYRTGTSLQLRFILQFSITAVANVFPAVACLRRKFSSETSDGLKYVCFRRPYLINYSVEKLVKVKTTEALVQRGFEESSFH